MWTVGGIEKSASASGRRVQEEGLGEVSTSI